jgi:hypothetical protein
MSNFLLKVCLLLSKKKYRTRTVISVKGNNLNVVLKTANRHQTRFHEQSGHGLICVRCEVCSIFGNLRNGKAGREK